MVNVRRYAVSAGVAAATLAGTVLLPSVASASPGWDPVGSSGFRYAGDGVYASDEFFGLSTGGNFQVCVHSDSGSRWYELWEHDPSNPDEKVGSTRYQVEGGCETWNDIGAYVDGENNRAEFYIRTNDAGAYQVDYFD